MNAPVEIQPAMLPVVERAKTALGTAARETALAELATRSVGITTITNPDGLKECHAARMLLKNERVAIEKVGKAAREDAKDFQQACIAEERRLVAIIEPEEKRLQALEDAENKRLQQEKDARIRAEAERLAAINRRIDWIRGRVVDLAGESAAVIEDNMQGIGALPLTVELYAEKLDEAREVAAATMAKLTAMVATAKANEAEKARLAEERIALEARQAEQRRADEARRELQAKEDEERRERQKQEDDARAARQREEDAARAAKFREIEEAQRYNADWDEAHRLDTERTERLAREKAEREADEKRRRERAELEAKADPWGALMGISEIITPNLRDGVLIDGVDPAQIIQDVYIAVGTAFLARKALERFIGDDLP